MEVETWIDGPSSPIPNPLPADFQYQEVLPVGYMGIANSSRKGGISARMGGKRVFGTLFHPYIVGGRFAWCNGVWFVLTCLEIPTIVARIGYCSPTGGLISGKKTTYNIVLDIASANYFDDSIESHFAFLNPAYFAWILLNYSNDYSVNPATFPYPPFTESSSVPAPYYEVNLGVGAPVKKIASSTFNNLNITGLNQLDYIEIFPRPYCWSALTPYYKDGERLWSFTEGDFFEIYKFLAAFSFQEAQPYINNQLLYKAHYGTVMDLVFTIAVTRTTYYTLKTPQLPDPSWTGIKKTRTRTIDGYNFIEYAFEVKAQPCDIEITIDPAVSSTRTDAFCLDYADYNQLLNRFDNIEQRLNELPN
ncbi:hypothetical protein ACE1CI_30475 [Aerosakkonemataceae cyanobacterium BLCC-F50]|uniref:Uncharacterized protein n=1 Tax=Floridaenema flaviceps BLCC-F50 TaxID=3153642 RepID=A0ABV4XZV6_9CYAN